MDGTDAVTLTAAVTNDKNSDGVTWSVSGGGTLSSTTTSSATYTAPAATSSSQSITVTATSIADTSKTGTVTLTVPAAPAVTTASTSLAWTVGTANSVTLAGSGGISPYTWTESGTLPTCLTMTAAGVIAGTPTASCAGAYTITFTMTDSGTPTKLTASKQLTITIAAAPAITFTGTVPGTGTYGVAYSGSAAATGGAGTLTYSISAGALPADLSLNTSTGAISGTPSKAADVGTFNFTVTAADAFGDSATHSYQLVISYPAVTITPGAGALPLAVTGQTYTQTLTAAGGSGTGFTWTVSGLSNGLTSSSSGATLTISGPATSTGTVTFTASVKDSANNTVGPYTYTIQVYSPVTIPATIPGTLPATGTVGLAYTGTVVATGGSGNYSWTVSGLSNGLSSSSSGATLTISGTPTAAGTVTANVSVKDTTTNVTAGPYAYAITLYSTVTLPAANPATLGPAIVNTSYSGTVVAAGGSGNYTWTVSGLPAGGLNYSTSGGTLTISGTPTATGAVSFNASIKDNTTNQTAGPISYSVTAYNAITLNAASLPAYGTVSTAFSGTVVATGGSGTGYTWTVTGLSDGLSSSSSGGTLTISGTPTAAATVTASVSVKDSVGNTAGPTNYTINIYNALSLPSPNPATLGPATVNAAYSGTIVGSGGSGNYSWTVTGLPANGLSSSSSGGTLTISGTPTATGATSFNVTLKDTTTNATVGPFSYSVTAYNTVTLPAPNPATLGAAMVGASYSGTIVAAGGSGNYTWTVTGLSNGLTSSSSGATLTISGTPTTATNVSFNVTVKDNSTSATAGPTTYTITVYAALSLPTPNPSSLPSTGYTGVAYSGTINASGGSGNYTWQATGLSDNLTATPSGGVLTISGTPSTATTVTFSVKLTDTTTSANITQSGYSITISTPTPVTLPTPNPSSLPSATVNQSYSGAINASGGVPPYTWSINGTTVGSGGTSLGNGTLTATSTSGSTLSISGTPSSTGTVTLTNVKVVDSLSTNATQTYTIAVNPSGGTISGQFSMPNYCFSGSSNLPVTFTVTITNTSTSAQQQTTTQADGSYSFTGVPFATYTIAPSVSGAASSLFYPTGYSSVTISSTSSSATGKNFNADVRYNLSGNVSYSGSQTGQTYLYVLNNNCGSSSGNPGTSITAATLSAGGAYTIHGVPPGSYTLNAWMDSTGIPSGTSGYNGAQGAQNTNDPTGNNGSVTVSNASVSNANVTLSNPTYATPASNPTMQVVPTVGGVLIFYDPPTVSTSSGSSEEAANEYVVEWAVANGSDSDGQTCSLGGGTGGAQFGTLAGSHTFYATGTGATVWILNNTSMGSGSFTAGGAYCFQARAFNTLASTTHPGGWTTPTDSDGNAAATTLLTTPTFCSSGCTTVSGTVSIPAGVSITSGAPLYVGFFQQSSTSKGPSALYAYQASSSPGSSNAYSLTIPSGTGYVLFGILDQNNDGAIDVGDVTNVRNNSSSGTTISGSSMTGVSLTLPGTSSSGQAQTQYQPCGTGCSSYNVDLQVNQLNKLPVAVTLYSGPNAVNPIDMSPCQGCGTTGQFDAYLPLLGGTPNVGDTYNFTVTYSDGSVDQGSAGTVNGKVIGWNNGSTVVGASNAASNLQTSGSNVDQPNFSWTDASSSTGSSFYYSFNLSQNNCTSGNCTIWQIPGENSSSNGFSSSTTSLTWGVDPTGGGSTPTGSLSPANTYNWSITVQDVYGNQATTSASYTP